MTIIYICMYIYWSLRTVDHIKFLLVNDYTIKSVYCRWASYFMKKIKESVGENQAQNDVT